MKLAEALLIRNELMKDVGSLKVRIAENATVQEGDAPSEDPDVLIQKALSALAELETLICKINRTNIQATLPDGTTMMATLAQRDCLIKQHAVLNKALENTQVKTHRQTREEIKWVKILDVQAIQKRADVLAAQIRKLNTAIQEANWQVELTE